MIDHPDFELRWPSRVAWVGFLLLWVQVAALIGFVFWLASWEGWRKAMERDSTATTTECAYARLGLLGNPSDGYGGKAIAVSLYDFSARVICAAFDALVYPERSNR